MSTIPPYPTSWSRMVDFFPSLHYSMELDPDVPMLEYRGHVSVAIRTTRHFRRPVSTELGEINIDPMNRRRLEYRAGSPDNSTPFNARDVWREIQQFLDVPDVTGKLRTIMRPVPRLLSEHDFLSNGAPLKIVETARGCYPRKLSEATGLPLFNVIRHAKNQLVSRELARYDDSETTARFKRMRSVWKTKTIVGYGNLGPIIRPLCRELTRDNWFQDAIEVRGFQVPINQLIVDGQIYAMHKLHRLLAI